MSSNSVSVYVSTVGHEAVCPGKSCMPCSSLNPREEHIKLRQKNRQEADSSLHYPGLKQPRMISYVLR